MGLWRNVMIVAWDRETLLLCLGSLLVKMGQAMRKTLHVFDTHSISSILCILLLYPNLYSSPSSKFLY